MQRIKDFFKILWLPVLAASLCCLSPLVLVVLGLSTVSFAASLADTFYGTYKWAFRAVGLILLGFSLWLYFRKQGICTLDQAKRRRNEIINKVLVSLIVGVAAYIVWLYVIVHYWGVWLNVWY